VFRRLVFENYAAIFTLAAFITALSIYLMISWRALRMKRPQIERFENLPFETETPAAELIPAPVKVARRHRSK
jgi:hypothetical protein